MATAALLLSIFTTTALGVVAGSWLSLWLMVEMTKPRQPKKE